MLGEGAERFDLPMSRETDGLAGPVRRVVVEQAQFVEQEGRLVEGPCRPLSVAEYNDAGFATYREARYYSEDGSPPQTFRDLGDGKGHSIESVALGPNGSLRWRLVREHLGDDWETATLYRAGRDVAWRMVKRRDELGRLVETTRYRGDGSLVTRDVNAYDADGRPILEEHYDTRDMEPSWRKALHHDGSGRLAEVTRSRLDGQVVNRLTHRYDSAGHVVETVHEDEDGTLVWRGTYTYDAAGNLAVQEAWGPDGTAQSREENWYDAQGRRIEQRQYGEDGLLAYAFTWERDDQGRIITSTEVEDGGASVTRTVVERDEYGNWTRVTWCQVPPEGSGAPPKPLQVDYQHIDYYADAPAGHEDTSHGQQ